MRGRGGGETRRRRRRRPPPPPLLPLLPPPLPPATVRSGMPPKPIRKVATGDATGPPEGQGPGGDRTSFLKKKKKQEEEVPFHHHWRVGVHRHKGDIYVKLPGGRVEQLKGEKEELCLGVVEARHLPQMDMGADTSAEDRAAGIGVTCDAFVTVQLGEQKRKTEVVHDTLSPYFGASFVFVLTDHTDERAEIARRLSDLSVLRIEVRDWDDGGDTDFVGMCELPMEELYTKDHMDRFQYIDTWIDLCNEDGTPAKIRLVTHVLLCANRLSHYSVKLRALSDCRVVLCRTARRHEAAYASKEPSAAANRWRS